MDVERISWNYDTRIATSWDRLGECNGCGDCCEMLIYLHKARAEDDGVPREDYVYDGSEPHATDGLPGPYSNGGTWAEQDIDGDRRFIQYVPTGKPGERCTSFTADRECVAHESGTKRFCCSAFPIIPDDMVNLPRCSYTFEKITEWKFSGDDDGVEEHGDTEDAEIGNGNGNGVKAYA